jgi:hypothetical protein
MPVTIRIDPGELNRLKLDLDAADKKLTTALRKRIKAAGQVAVDAIRDALDDAPPAGQPDPSGFREALQAGTSTAVSFSRTGASVKIKTSSSRLPAGEKDLFAAYNSKRGYRIPLFGDSRRTFSAQGRPYFGAAVLQRSTISNIQDEVLAALDAAVDALGGRIR